MAHETDEVTRLRAAVARLQAENEQFHAEIEHLVDSRRTAEDTLARYLDLYDHAPLPLLTLDGLGLIHEMNLTAAGMLGGQGSRPASLVGQRLRRFAVEADHGVLVDHLRRCQAATAPISTELRLRRPGSEPLVVALWSRRARPDMRSYPSALVDLTESRRNAGEIERLVEAEKSARIASEAKDQFIAVLSHELRTPLTPVLAAASALAAREDLDPHVRNICEMMRRNVVTEARLIDDLLDVSRIVRGKMHLRRELVDVHELASEVLGMIANEADGRRIIVMEGLEARRHWAFADPIRLRQVLWNLLRNAIKFTPDGGRIELRSWNREGRFVIEVSDSGAGFDEETAPRLFEAFEQDRETPQRFGGLGLGLAICKGIIDLHGGSIAGTSAGRGKGARFVVEIDTAAEPASAATLREAQESARAAPPPASQAALPDNTNGRDVRAARSLPARPSRGSTPAPVVSKATETKTERVRILLVEDDPDTGDMLRDLLSDAGYDVRMVRSAGAALAEKLERVDLVLSDIGLPDGSGLDLMRAIRDRRAIKGIALSGYGTEADIRASREAGFEAHLTKPIELNGLLEVIDQVAATV